MNATQLLDAEALLASVSNQIPEPLRANVVIVGSVATAWAFRDLLGTAAVATKDIDVILTPAITAVATAEVLGQRLLEEHWLPQFTEERQPGTAATPLHELPALRVVPPGERTGWFIELLSMPPAGQTERRKWTRFQTTYGHFALPSFRHMPIAVHAPEQTPSGLAIARPATMALAHLLEHADPDGTPVRSLPSQPPRFVKDIGRAVSLWWLAGQQSAVATERWRVEWESALMAHQPSARAATLAAASKGLANLEGSLREAHAIARLGVLAPHGTNFDAFERAYLGLTELVQAG